MKCIIIAFSLFTLLFFTSACKKDHPSGGSPISNPTATQLPIFNFGVSYSQLSEPKSDPIVLQSGNFLLFAGGITNMQSRTISDKIDVLNAETNTWYRYSFPDFYPFEGIVSDEKIILRGYNESTNHFVKIYNTLDNSWSTYFIPEAMYSSGFAFAGDKLYFAMGSPRENLTPAVGTYIIYDITTRASVSGSLSQGRGRIAVAATGDKVIFAGGESAVINYDHELTSRIDIYTISTQTWSTTEFLYPELILKSVVAGNKIFLLGSSTINNASPVHVFDAVRGIQYAFSVPEFNIDIPQCQIINNKLGISAFNHFSLVDINNNYSAKTKILGEISNDCMLGYSNNKVLIGGGFSYQPPQNGPTYKIKVYDILKDSVKTYQMPFKMTKAGIGSASDHIFIGGGINQTNSLAIDTVYKIRL